MGNGRTFIHWAPAAQQTRVVRPVAGQRNGLQFGYALGIHAQP